MAGYSGAPLTKKLGIKEGFCIVLANAPKGFELELTDLPADVQIGRPGKPLDLILLFAKSRSDLEKQFAKMAAKIAPNGILWVAWRKKASGILTDLSFDSVQRIGLNAGLVDVKICAINDIWSGLKFVYRLKNRPRP